MRRIAAGRANGMIYREGKAIRRVKESEIVPALLEEINRFIADKEAGINTAPPEIVPASEPEGSPNSLVTVSPITSEKRFFGIAPQPR